MIHYAEDLVPFPVMRLGSMMLPLVLSITADAQTNGFGAHLPDTTALPKLSVELWTGLPVGYKLPKSVDLSRWFPPAGDQGRQYSCVPWALCYGIMSYRMNRWHGRTYGHSDLVDSAHTFSPAYLYNMFIGFDRKRSDPPADSVCSNGTDIDKVLTVAMVSGACMLKDMPYDTTMKSCCQPPGFVEDLKAISYRIPPATKLSEYDPTQWRYHLSKDQPILVGMVVDEKLIQTGYETGGDSMITYDLWNDGGNSFGHAMVCTGYNEDGTFTFLNSWGLDWSYHGYFKVTIAALEQKCYNAYVLSNDSTVTWELLPGRPAAREINADSSSNAHHDIGDYHIVKTYKVKLADLGKRDRSAVMQVFDADTDTLVRVVLMHAGLQYVIYEGSTKLTMSYRKRWFLKRWLGIPVHSSLTITSAVNDEYIRKRNSRLSQLKGQIRV